MLRPDDAGPLAAYVREQVEAIDAHAPDIPDTTAVHRTRVATRRLRSTLRVYGPLLALADEEAEAAGEELRWYGGLLGDVRDRQVQRARFAAALEALPPEDVLGPVGALLDGMLHGEQVRAEQELAQVAESERFLRLHRLLATWGQDPPVGEVEVDALRKRARKAARTARRRLEDACPDGTDAELHRARKAAKRARYAGELLEPTGHGKKQRKRFKRIQVLLGDHQDAVVAEATLRRLVTDLPDGGSAFTFGLLHARERAEADRLRREVCERYVLPGA
jgi:CHAD domain-containing protein